MEYLTVTFHRSNAGPVTVSLLTSVQGRSEALQKAVDSYEFNGNSMDAVVQINFTIVKPD